MKLYTYICYGNLGNEFQLSNTKSGGAGAESVTVKPPGCEFDRSLLENIYLNLYFHFFALLSSATQHAMPSEFGREWGTECLTTRFPLPTLLCAGYSVKLIIFNNTKS